VDPLRNPYTPNAGAEPLALVGRDALLRAFDLLLSRIAAGRSEQSMIVTGLRGVGKTVLLNHFRNRALAKDWVVVDLEATKNDEAGFRKIIASQLRSALLELSPKKRWTDRIRHAAAVLKSFTVSVDPAGKWSASLDIEAADGFADHHDLALDLTDVLVALGQAAKEQQKGVVILFDEMQFLGSNQLGALIQALHKVVQRNLPLTLVGAGLPQIAALAGDAKSYAERLFRFPEIGNLSTADAEAALQWPAEDEDASFSKEALKRAVEITGGYPYFLQELGYAAWIVADGPEIGVDDVVAAYDAYLEKLDSSFFRVRLDRATDLQRAYLRAMAELGPEPHRTADVAAVMGRTSQNLGPTRAELINMGLLYTPEHGVAAFTVPKFDEYMLRAVPELVVPERRQRKPKSKK